MNLRENKTKSILFASRRILRLVGELDIRYKAIEIKHHKHGNYLACMLDETMVGESICW